MTTNTSSTPKDDYYNNIEKIPVLSNEEFIKLFTEYKNGSKSAQDKLIYHNLRLVLKISIKYIGLGLPHDDLFQEGTLGLYKALKGYNPENAAFSTYAAIKIKRSIILALYNKARIISLPVWVHDEIKKYNVLIRNFISTNKRYPNNDELTKMGISLKLLDSVKKSDVIYLDKPIVKGAEETIVDNIKDNGHSLEDIVYKKMLSDNIEKILNELHPMMRHVIEKLYGLNGNDITRNIEISKELGKTAGDIFTRTQRTYNALSQKKTIKNLHPAYDKPDIFPKKDNPNEELINTIEKLFQKQEITNAEKYILQNLFINKYSISKLLEQETFNKLPKKDLLIYIQNTINKFLETFKKTKSKSRV